MYMAEFQLKNVYFISIRNTSNCNGLPGGLTRPVSQPTSPVAYVRSFTIIPVIFLLLIVLPGTTVPSPRPTLITRKRYKT